MQIKEVIQGNRIIIRNQYATDYHSFVDGIHVGKFVDELQKYLNSLMLKRSFLFVRSLSKKEKNENIGD